MKPVYRKRFGRLLAAMRQEDETLLKLDVGFNMGPMLDDRSDISPDRSGHQCGTVACIAGTAALLSCRSDTERIKFI